MTNSAVVNNSVEHFNSSFGPGIVVRSFSSSPTNVSLTNCSIRRTNKCGAALWVEAGGPLDLSLTNSNVNQNNGVEAVRGPYNYMCGGLGGGVFLYCDQSSGSLTADLKNSIFWGNKRWDGSGTDLEMMTGSSNTCTQLTVNADHNDIGQRLTSSGTFNDLGGNIAANPLVSVSRVHLKAGSPCIDTGTCMGAPTTDFEGDPRPSGAGCDMGADEFVP